MNIWKDIIEKDEKFHNYKRLQAIGETKWTAKETALKRIFGTYNSSGDDNSFVDLLFALKKVLLKGPI